MIENIEFKAHVTQVSSNNHINNQTVNIDDEDNNNSQMPEINNKNIKMTVNINEAKPIISSSSNVNLNVTIDINEAVEVEESHLREQLKDFNSYLKLVPIVVSYDHTVCVSVRNYKEGSIPQPHPAKRRDKWDSSHVGMPFSSKNEFPVKEGNQTVIKERFIFQILMSE